MVLTPGQGLKHLFKVKSKLGGGEGEGLGAQPQEADISNSEDRDLTNRVNTSVPFQKARFKARAKLKTKPT